MLQKCVRSEGNNWRAYWPILPSLGIPNLAAETVIGEVKAIYSHIESAEQWSAALAQIDCRVAAGEATAVVVDLRADGICGSSVGDSQAWIIHDGSLFALTSDQVRKPLLGSGGVAPVGFAFPPLTGVLIVATDGFCDYMKSNQLPPMFAKADFYEIPRRCGKMVRLPSGDLWDDIGTVACRIRPRHRTRKRYTI